MAVSHMLKKVLPVVLVLAVCLAGPGRAEAQVRAFVSILPQKYFVERLAGDLAEVDVLVLPGANPHMYEPSPRQMTALAKAQVYFAIGVNLEDVWLPKLADANRDLRIVRTQEGVDKIPMAEHHHEGGEQEAMHAGGEHGDGILDPHIWLDPVRVKTVAANTCAGLVAVDPAHQAEYEANLAAFVKELDALNASIVKTLSAIPADGRTFMVFHPSWGYFAARYGLTQVPIEAGGNEPSPKHLVEIIEHGRERGVNVVFIQPQFSRRSAEVIASELGARVVPLDPLAEDWKDNLQHAAEAFGQALR